MLCAKVKCVSVELPWKLSSDIEVELDSTIVAAPYPFNHTYILQDVLHTP